MPVAKSDVLTALIWDIFKVNNLALAWGDRLVAPLGLTSARWQVLGAIVAAERPQPVAWLARDLGAYRQNVQRIANDLAAEGLVETAPNPHHRRAHLIVLTDKGRKAYDAAIEIYTNRVAELTLGLPAERIGEAHSFIRSLRNTFETEADL